MKKVFLLMALAFACVFTSCKKDDDSPKEPTASLIGKWEITEELIQQNGQWVNHNPKHKEGAGHYWEFSATEMVSHDPCDLLNGVSFTYSYDPEAKKLTLLGIVGTVETLTAKDLIIINVDQKTVFKKMN